MAIARRHLTLVLTALLATACGKTSTTPTTPGASTSGGSTSGTPTSSGSTGGALAGIAAPKEVSALPTKAAGTQDLSASSASSYLVLGRAKALATVPGTDYSNAPSFKFVHEQALSQFDVLNTIFKALADTHYADPENVDKGPYGCMVTWSEDHGGSPSKQIVPWVVDSKMTVDANGKDVNTVQIWMQMPMGDEQLHLIQAELDLYEAPIVKADGSYADYGVWTLNAKFDETGTSYFAASSEHDASGGSIVRLHEVDVKGGGSSGPGPETRGILKRSDVSGYGVVLFPDYSSCNQPDCQPQPVTVSYAYDSDHVALKNGASPVVFKDRTTVVDLVNRYGLYDAVTGDDVTKTHSFGFPITFTDTAGMHYGYYGAWQGRHQLGYDGSQQIPAGTTVTCADRPPNAAPESYIVSAPFLGSLVKRTLVPGEIQGIKDIVVQTFVQKSFQLVYDGSKWATCGDAWTNVNPFSGSITCGDGSAPAAFTDFASLVLNPNDPQRQVMLNYSPFTQPTPCGAGPCSPPPPSPPETLVYLAGQGFFHTDWTPSPGPPTQPTSNGQALAPNPYDQIWANIGGPLYIDYDGSGFVQKTVLTFDMSTFQASFDPSGDVPYTLDLDREYYINTPGVNYVVKRTGANTYDVKTELQTVANPVNASTFVPAGTQFRQQWDQSACATSCPAHPVQSTYAFDAAAMKLVYDCISDSDASNGVRAGDVVKNGQWGLVAYDAHCTSTGVQYNWDYPQDGQSFGNQQFLRKGDGSFLILDDPIRLASIAIPNHSGDVQTLALQFDGNWVNGLPDIYNELQQNGFVMTAALADKVVVIPAGTDVVDATDSTKHYLFKPLQTDEFLAIISDPGDVDLAPASALDLTTVPAFVDHHLGPLPTAPLKYSEGNPVQ